MKQQSTKIPVSLSGNPTAYDVVVDELRFISNSFPPEGQSDRIRALRIVQALSDKGFLNEEPPYQSFGYFEKIEREKIEHGED